jgi:hypothetical protein
LSVSLWACWGLAESTGVVSAKPCPDRRCKRSISSACSLDLLRSASISERIATSVSAASPVAWRLRPPRVVSAIDSRSICAFF